MDVLCNQCHWQGSEEQLVPIYKPNPKEPGDVIPVPGCPGCLSDQFLEYQELREPPIVSQAMEDASKDVANELIKYQREADIKWMKEHCYLKAKRELPEMYQGFNREGILHSWLYHESQRDMLKEVDGVSFKAVEEFKDV